MHHIADVNDTSALNFSGPYAVTEVNTNAPRFASELSDGLRLLACETYRCAFVSFKCLHCSAVTKRRHIYTAGWEAQPSGGKQSSAAGVALSQTS